VEEGGKNFGKEGGENEGKKIWGSHLPETCSEPHQTSNRVHQSNLPNQGKEAMIEKNKRQANKKYVAGRSAPVREYI